MEIKNAGMSQHLWEPNRLIDHNKVLFHQQVAVLIELGACDEALLAEGAAVQLLAFVATHVRQQLRRS